MFKIYSKDGCPFCVQAKMLLDRIGIEYEVIDIEESKETYQSFKSKYRTVPQIFNQDEYIGGFDSLQDYLVDREYV
jgi:glutaredoxin